MKNSILFIISLISFSCNKVIDDKALIEMFNSKDKKKVLTATEYVSKHNKYQMTKYLLSDAVDPRVLSDLRHKGMSIYQIKMNTMQKMTGIESPKRITYRPDSTIVKFYIDIAKKKRWVDSISFE